MLGRSEAFTEKTAAAPQSIARENRMRMRYGFNEIYGWWHLSQGEHRAKIQRRLRLMDTKVMRVFAFDQPVPDPVKDWSNFASYLQGVLDAGAKPMVTFAKFHPPYDNTLNVEAFIARCTELVWSCIEHWGGDEVKDWYWCVWNEPNNLLVGGDIAYSQYVRIYREVAAAVQAQLAPYLRGQRLMIGGPAIDGTHRPYWMDWIARLLNDVDESLLAFVSWHRYGDWRPAVPSESLDLEMWGSPDSPNGPLFEQLLMAQTPGYEAYASGVSRLLAGRNILNVCGELNAISHHEQYYTLGLNQNVFGAAYYASALIRLIRGGADLEMRWTATIPIETDAYGLIGMKGEPKPAALGKQLFAQHVRYGDLIHAPEPHLAMPGIDVIFARNEQRVSGVFVNTSSKEVALKLSDWDSGTSYTEILRLDSSTGEKIKREPFDGTVRIQGYGLAVVSDAAAETVID